MRIIKTSNELVCKVVEYMIQLFGDKQPLIAMSCNEASILPYSFFRSSDGMSGFQIIELFNEDEPLGLLYCKLDSKGWIVSYRPKERGRQILTQLRKMKTNKKRVTYLNSTFMEEVP